MKEKNQKPLVEPDFLLREANKIVDDKCQNLLCVAYTDYAFIRHSPNKVEDIARHVHEINKTINLVCGPRSPESDELYRMAMVNLHEDWDGGFSVSIGDRVDLPDLRRPMNFRRNDDK